MAANKRLELPSLLPKSMEALVRHSGKAAMADGHDSNFSDNISEARVAPQQVKPTELAIRCVSSRAAVSEKVMCTMGADIISPLWSPEPLSGDEALILYLEIFGYFFGKTALTDNSIINELTVKGYKIIIEEIDPAEEATRDYLKNLSAELSLSTATNIEGIESDRILIESMMFSVILLMGKNLVENSNQIWFQRRTQNFAATMGRDGIPAIPAPSLQVVRGIYSKISSLHRVRRECFRIIKKSSSLNDRISPMSTVALNLLSYTEMAHIQIIFEYIICNYVQILQSRLLQGENTANFGKVLTFIASVPLSDRPFIKLLYPPQETKVMHRERFPLIIDAAYAVASYIKPTFKNYRGSSHDTSKRITTEVTEYLNRLSSNKAAVMLAGTYATTSSEIVEAAPKAQSFFRLNTETAAVDDIAERS